MKSELWHGAVRAPWAKRLLSFALVLTLSACAGATRLPPPLPGEFDQVTVLDRTDIRYVMPDDTHKLTMFAISSMQREAAHYGLTPDSDELPPVAMLAISGGGDNGAFGAGLLNGWTDFGTRPEFRLVTGISTGALTAPFAFLGPDYDDELEAAFTTITSDDIFIIPGVVSAAYDFAFGMAAGDNAPLHAYVARYADEEMLRRIAEEYAKGRLLLIATTNLDASKPVLWDMGAIASSGHPDALQLFRDILVASAAVPAIVPPVLIDVQVNGERRQEMHVDGGVTAQVFLFPPNLPATVEALGFKMPDRERNLYIIRNAYLAADFAEVEPRGMSITGRSISSLIRTQGIGDLYLIYSEAVKDGFGYHVAIIEPDFTERPAEEFDQAYMNTLYNYAYDLAANGYPWREVPPGLEVPQQ